MTDAAPRDRLLDAAERLFGEHGYAAVTLRDLARAAGLHHSSLYHHAPGGKAEIFVGALERSHRRHAGALAEALADLDAPLRDRLRRVAGWVLANPPTNHTRLLTTDLDQLPEGVGERLGRDAWEHLIVPIADALRAEAEAGRVALPPERAETVAGALLASLQALQAASARYADADEADAGASYLIDLFLDGLRPRAPASGAG